MSFEDPSGGSYEGGEERYYGDEYEGEEGFDYGEGESEAEIGGYEDEKSEGEEDVGEDIGGGDDEEGPDFKSTYADFQRTAGGAIGTGVSRIQKSKRSVQEAAQDKAKGILNDGSYDQIVESDEKQKVYNTIAKIDNIERYNIETLVPAIIFVNKGYSLDKNFKSFFKKLTDINNFDLIRYIRFLTV
jgi:hypothetical protein